MNRGVPSTETMMDSTRMPDDGNGFMARLWVARSEAIRHNDLLEVRLLAGVDRNTGWGVATTGTEELFTCSGAPGGGVTVRGPTAPITCYGIGRLTVPRTVHVRFAVADARAAGHRVIIDFAGGYRLTRGMCPSPELVS